MINAGMMNGNANVCEVAPAIKGGISLTLSSCQIHHCQGWLPVSPTSHQLQAGSSGVKEKDDLQFSACMRVRLLLYRANANGHESNSRCSASCLVPFSDPVSVSLSLPDTCYITWSSCSLPLPSSSALPQKSQHFCIQHGEALPRIILDLICVCVSR